MRIEQAIELIRHPVLAGSSPGIWADLGCGSGLFTQALAELVLPGSKIYAVDKDLSGFKNINVDAGIEIHKIEADFISDQLNIRNIDGILMANSLHFVRDKAKFIKQTNSFFRSESIFLIVEYDTDTANAWIPYPVSFYSLQRLFGNLGYTIIHKLHEQPSRFNRQNIYSAYLRQ
jgi:ubiquinone/menaquinone biosynthesis C-methylase UbiE